MNQPSTTPKVQTHVKYGVAIGLISVIVSLIIYYTGNTFASWASIPGYVVGLIGFIMNAREYSNANQNDVTFGEIFSSGFKATCIYTLIMLAWTIISNKIFPEIMEQAMEKARDGMVQNGMSDAQIDQALEMTAKYQNVFIIAGAIFGGIIFGIVCTLIGAALAKRKKNTPTFQ